MLFNFIQHNDDWRLVAKTLDEFKPILRVHIFAAFAPVEDEQIEATLGEKELMRRVHDLLPAEIPHVEPHVLIAVEPERPFRDAYTVRLLLAQFEFIMY